MNQLNESKPTTQPLADQNNTSNDDRKSKSQ